MRDLWPLPLHICSCLKATCTGWVSPSEAQRSRAVKTPCRRRRTEWRSDWTATMRSSRAVLGLGEAQGGFRYTQLDFSNVLWVIHPRQKVNKLWPLWRGPRCRGEPLSEASSLMGFEGCVMVNDFIYEDSCIVKSYRSVWKSPCCSSVLPSTPTLEDSKRPGRRDIDLEFVCRSCLCAAVCLRVVPLW